MRNTVIAGCALVPAFRGKLVQKYRRNAGNVWVLPTATSHTSRPVVRKAISSPQFERILCSTLSTAVLQVFPDQSSGLYPLSTGPTISKNKINEYIVERSR